MALSRACPSVLPSHKAVSTKGSLCRTLQIRRQRNPAALLWYLHSAATFVLQRKIQGQLLTCARTSLRSSPCSGSTPATYPRARASVAPWELLANNDLVDSGFTLFLPTEIVAARSSKKFCTTVFSGALQHACVLREAIAAAHSLAITLPASSRWLLLFQQRVMDIW